MSSRASSAGPPSSPRADDAVTGLLPPRRRRAGVVVAGLAVLVLVVAWFSPQLLRPSIWSGSGGGVLVPFTTSGPQVLTTSTSAVESWLPFTVEEVGDVPGARVVDAWLVTGAQARRAEQGLAGTPSAPHEYLADILTDPREAHLPQRVTSDERAALMVLWAIEDCAALEEGVEPVATLRNAIGATITDTAGPLAAPDPELLAAPESPVTGLATEICPAADVRTNERCGAGCGARLRIVSGTLTGRRSSAGR